MLPYDEEPLLDALARLHAAGKDVVAEGSRFVGMFRAHGRLVPVWDLPSGTGADVLEEPAQRFARRPRAARWPTRTPLTADGAVGPQRAREPAADDPLSRAG